jgi:radical SAM protein with 4Fe4S-binding SPASM domain
MGVPDLRLIFWELTARCNLRCQHCRAEAFDGFAPNELTTEDVLGVARSIRAFADPIMVLTGGEPLARPDFFTIARACSDLYTRVALATNGTLIDEAMAREIAACRISRISVSLDGAVPATHDAFRGQPGSFQAALAGIAALRSLGLSVQINVTVTRHNETELPALLALALALGADAFHVFALVPVGCGAEIPDDGRLTPERTETLLRWLAGEALTRRDQLFIKATCAPQYYRILREEARAHGVTAPAGHGHGGLSAHTRGCLAGSGVCFISRTGDVQPCGYLPLSVGNVRTEALADIWVSSPVFAALRDPEQLSGKCGVCAFRRLCQGCRARAFATSGDYLAAEPDCAYQPRGGERV